MNKPASVDNLSQLYEDNKACAKLVGLSYVENERPGISRQKHGKGFVYHLDDRPLTNARLKQRIAELVIPPAWRDVWISPDEQGHILATGTDDKGRKQYIYHPKWRTMRDLIKFYRLLIFARALPKIRRIINQDLDRPTLDRHKVIGVMLWLLDNTYLRIGNDTYFTQNDSVGLTTLSDKNLIVAGSVTTLAFTGKSGKQQQITFDNPRIARIITQLIDQRGSRLFRYKDGSRFINIESADINTYLHEATGLQISAKDFRTWVGTLMAFNHLVETEKQGGDNKPKAEKVAVQAVDAAAQVLGNTRAIARASYVHPHILQLYAAHNFSKHYQQAVSAGRINGLDKRETELVHVLEELFKTEFDLIKD